MSRFRTCINVCRHQLVAQIWTFSETKSFELLSLYWVRVPDRPVFKNRGHEDVGLRSICKTGDVGTDPFWHFIARDQSVVLRKQLGKPPQHTVQSNPCLGNPPIAAAFSIKSYSPQVTKVSEPREQALWYAIFKSSGISTAGQKESISVSPFCDIR